MKESKHIDAPLCQNNICAKTGYKLVPLQAVEVLNWQVNEAKKNKNIVITVF
jgi:hypothetical protein